MRKFWKGFRKPDHLDEEKIRTRKEILGKLQRIIHEGRHEAEQEFVDLMRELIPTISKEELLERIRQFHDAVSDAQAHDREFR